MNTNLITGAENSLVKIVDTDNDQGDNITWLTNLLYPTDNATILEGATTTSFDAMEIINENPHLAFDAGNNIWKTTKNTPLYENAVTSETIEEDIEGQERPTTSNLGADHYSLESIRFTPLAQIPMRVQIQPLRKNIALVKFYFIQFLPVFCYIWIILTLK